MPAKQDLLAALEPHDAFDLLAGWHIAHSSPRAESRPLHGVQAAPELLALLLLERGARAAATEGSEEDGFVSALERFETFANTTLMITPGALVPLPIPADKSPEAALANIRNRACGTYLLLPVHETGAQSEQTTSSLFGDPLVRSHLREELGLDAETVLRLTDSVAELTRSGWRETIEAGRESRSWLGHGERLSFAVEKLATAAEVEFEQAREFVARFSLTFDGSPVGFAPLTTRARHRPLLRDGERVMPISIPILRQTLRGSLAALLNPALPEAAEGNAAAFAAFTARRGAWLERKAMSLLEGALSPDWAELNVNFSLPDGAERSTP